ncbi:MAG: hypothetical protein ACM3U0_01995 [archaeon]
MRMKFVVKHNFIGIEMSQSIKEILKKADDTYRLRYLLGKDDTDDINTAILVLKNRLKQEIPELEIFSFTDRIEIKNLTDTNYTAIAIRLKEEHLVLKYNLYGRLDLFNRITEPDKGLIEKVKNTITSLGFYKIDENEAESDEYHSMIETYKLRVIRRRP